MLNLFVALQTRFAQLRDERGATAVEYGLLVALIAGVLIVVIGFLGTDIKNAFSGVETGIDGTPNG
jgi:pilus assembly protein Flp/PilA